MIFGFVKGVDMEIDIYPYLMDTDNSERVENFYELLNSKYEIENNIF